MKLGQLEITGKKINPETQFGAVISEEDMSGIQSLFESPKVLLLTNPETWETEGVNFIRVIIKPGSLLIFQTKRLFYEVKMTMLLPLRNTQKE